MHCLLQVLPQTLQFVVGVLTADPPMEPQKREGALRLIGCLADVLLKKKLYKVQVENMLVSQVNSLIIILNSDIEKTLWFFGTKVILLYMAMFLVKSLKM